MSALTDIQIPSRLIGAYNALLLDLTRLARNAPCSASTPACCRACAS